MEQDPSWAASNHLSGQETPRLLWNPKVSLQCSQGPTADPILKQMNSAPPYLTLFLEGQF
jgi:hypothetical protein